MFSPIIHSIILITVIALSFIFPKTSLAKYDLQISALLFIILFIGKKIFVDSDKKENFNRLLESIIFTLIVMILINSTGGSASPFFFLIYFLLFSLSLLLEPIISITTTLTLVIFFLFSLPENQSFSTFLPIFSLAFLTPFAMFLGEEYKKNTQLKTSLTNNKEQTLLFLSLMLKNHIKSIKTALENFMGDHELNEIKNHTKQMEKLIDRFEETTP